ncbi:MAG: AI-2E family transporter [Candidatus Micrarchaeia archaeon]|jgi:predicted PurR-regulated permease PerM
MNMLRQLQLRNYLFWAVLLGFLLVSAFMVLPFVGAIISAYILAYLVRPVFLRLAPRFGNTPAAILCLLATIIVIVVPISLIAVGILDQMSGISTNQEISNIVDAFTARPFLRGLSINTVDLKAAIILAVNNMTNSAIESIPNVIIGLVVTLNCMFYLMCNWNQLASHMKKYLPFKNNDKMLAELGGTADAIIRGHGSVSLLEGVIAFFGFSLLGIQASLIFAVVLFIFAFMPGIGTELVWVPMAFYYFSIGQYATMWGIIAIGLLLWVGIEFYFYTRFVGAKSRIHPFLLLIGVLGGIGVFGIFGFIIGPLILVNSIKIIEGAIGSREV